MDSIFSFHLNLDQRLSKVLCGWIDRHQLPSYKGAWSCCTHVWACAPTCTLRVCMQLHKVLCGTTLAASRHIWSTWQGNQTLVVSTRYLQLGCNSNQLLIIKYYIIKYIFIINITLIRCGSTSICQKLGSRKISSIYWATYFPLL